MYDYFRLTNSSYPQATMYIPAKPLHNNDTVSVHFNLIFIAQRFTTNSFYDVFLMTMLALKWLGYISLCSYHIAYIMIDIALYA